MKKEIFSRLKKEVGYILIIFLIILAIFNFIFYKEIFLVKLSAVFSFFWLFILPGYAIMLYWNEKLEFIERFIIGIAAAAAVTGISSYYLGLLGLNLKYNIYLLPIILIVAGIFFASRKNID